MFKPDCSRWLQPTSFHGITTAKRQTTTLSCGALTIETRHPYDRCELKIGERYQIRPGTTHLISNRGADDCEFLLVQGVGKYDWIKAEG